MKNNLTKYMVSLYPTGTIKQSGSSAPVNSGFFVPVVWNNLPMRRVDRAEYNTRKGNKLSRLCSVVETRRFSKRGETTKNRGGTK